MTKLRKIITAEPDRFRLLVRASQGSRKQYLRQHCPHDYAPVTPILGGRHSTWRCRICGQSWLRVAAMNCDED